MRKVLPERVEGNRSFRSFSIILISAILAFIAVGFSCRCLANLINPLPAFLGRPKIKMLNYELRKNDIDTLFFGTSRIEFDVNPSVFDEESKKDGCNTSSFNFGIAGSRYADFLFLVRAILRDPPPHLRTVYFEPNLNQVSGEWRAPYVRRYLFPSLLPNLIREAIANPSSSDAKWSNLAAVTVAFAYENTGISSLSEAIAKERRPDASYYDRGGFRPVDMSDDGRNTPHKGRFPDDSEGTTYDNLLKVWSPEEYKVVMPGPWRRIFESEFDLLRKLTPNIREIIPPSVYWNQPAIIATLRKYHYDSGVSFIDPAAAPPLYDVARWYDSGHLNLSGSILYSKLLADRECRPMLDQVH